MAVHFGYQKLNLKCENRGSWVGTSHMCIHASAHQEVYIVLHIK